LVISLEERLRRTLHSRFQYSLQEKNTKKIFTGRIPSDLFDVDGKKYLDYAGSWGLQFNIVY